MEKIEQKVNNLKQKVSDYYVNQNSFLEEIGTLNHFLASELDNNKKHNLRKEEAKDKIEEIRIRIQNVKENVNAAKILLSKLK